MSFEFNPEDEDPHSECRHEIERLNQWVADLQSGMYVNCVYCGHRYGPGETTPVSMADALKEHVQQCPEHPMSELKRENSGLRSEVADANLKLVRLRAALQNIVCVDGIDAGVIYLSHESPTHYDEKLKCHVYEHEHFSPLGDALVELWKLT